MVRKSLPVVFLSVLMLHASEESPFSDFVVGIWPEYDHPGVLVIYTGTVKSDHLPLHFEAFVPYEIDRALAVGQSQTPDDLEPVTVEVRDNEKWVTTTWVQDRFQLEFYFNPFTGEAERKGELILKMNHPLNTYHVAIQHPLAAERFTVSEPDAESFRDDHGILYSRIHFPSLPVGNSRRISFSYLNPTGRLSVALLQEVLNASPETSDSPSGESQGAVVRYRLPTYEPLVVLAALSLIVGYMFWKSNHRRPKTAEKEFCSKCGAKVGKGDRYCSTCGKELS